MADQINGYRVDGKDVGGGKGKVLTGGAKLGRELGGGSWVANGDSVSSDDGRGLEEMVGLWQKGGNRNMPDK